MTRFVKGATTVQFNQDPVRPVTSGTSLRQLRETDIQGNEYIYAKSTLKRSRYALRFPHLTDAVAAALRSFLVSAIDGTRREFLWIDHQETARTVKVAEPSFTLENVGPNQWSFSVELTEDVAA